MAAWTLAQMMSRAQRLLRDSNGFMWSDEEVRDAINEARDEFHEHVRLTNPDFLDVTTTLYSWPASQLSVDLSTVLSTVDFDVLLVAATPNVAAISNDNKPVPLRRINFENLYRLGAVQPMWPADYEATWLGTNVPFWALQGITLYLDPVPAQTLQIVLQTVPLPDALATDGTDDATAVLSLRFQRYQQLVVYQAAEKLGVKNGLWSEVHQKQLAELRTRLNEYLRRWSLDGTPMVNDGGR